MAGYAAFIIYHFDGPPRYFTVMIFPVYMVVAMFVAALWHQSRSAAWAVLAICAVAVTWNLWEVQKFVRHPEYSMLRATEQIRKMIDAHPESRRLMMGHAANETTLYIAVPSIDDSNGDWSETRKLAVYQPGWVLIWSDESLADIPDVTAQRRLVPMLYVPALDDKIRNYLLLYQVEPK
jgi:4-amino-4-deoxy-L-arabinose transferase-like glycosyltransferase